MNTYEVTFKRDGTIQSVVLLVGDPLDRITVQARNEGEAKRKAYNLYSAQKKKLAKERLHSAGRCGCGRDQDRYVQAGRFKGKWAKTCSVCAVRRQAQYNNSKNRGARTLQEAMAQRDEGARLDANLTRQRDRRAEIRLEVLLEVQKQWINSRNSGAFTKWVQDQIAICTGEKGAA